MVERKIFQTLDVIVGEEPVQEFEKDVLVLLAAEQILESPVRGGVDETLVLIIDEIAVLACHSDCVLIFRPKDLANRSIGSAMTSSLLKCSANLGSPTAGYESITPGKSSAENELCRKYSDFSVPGHSGQEKINASELWFSS